MKAFLEEYGLIVVAVIVILACIVIAHFFGDEFMSAMKSIMKDFFTKSGATACITNTNLFS
ncbi:MAG TPA: hypothetical protein VHQ24_12755 [Lachnospiraceae bacterium]|nr:hypothetical protein [Lachnospiraceae bacterium]